MLSHLQVLRFQLTEHRQKTRIFPLKLYLNINLSQPVKHWLPPILFCTPGGSIKLLKEKVYQAEYIPYWYIFSRLLNFAILARQYFSGVYFCNFNRQIWEKGINISDLSVLKLHFILLLFFFSSLILEKFLDKLEQAMCESLAN